MNIEDIKQVITILGKPTKITVEITNDNYQKLIDSSFIEIVSQYAVVNKINPRIHCFGCTIEFIVK
jgi:hypothetical protein